MRKVIRPIIFLISLTILGVWGIINVYHYAEDYGSKLVGEIMKELIKNESDSLYELEYDELVLDFTFKYARLTNAHLKPNTNHLLDSTMVNNLYTVSVDSVLIDLESIIKIYLSNKLIINAVTVVNPNVRMIKINPERRAIKFGRETGELYEIISSNLKVLQISNFTIKSGHINHQPSNVDFSEIEFEIKNFLVDREEKRKKVFYSESINLGLSNQEIVLPDSLHTLRFESFTLSTSDSLLIFEGVSVKANDSTVFENKKLKREKNLYDIEIPRIELAGINYLSAYEDNIIKIENVNIPNPKLMISTVGDENELKDESDNSLIKFLTEIFDELNVAHFRLDNAQIDLSITAENIQQFKSSKIDLSLFDVKLDSTNYTISSRSRYFKDAKIEVNDYAYQLPDSLHQAYFKQFSLNTIDSTLFFEGVRLSPFRKAFDSTQAIYNFSIPRMSMSGVNFVEALSDRRVLSREIIINRPDIRIFPLEQNFEREKIDTVFTPKMLSIIIKDLFYLIKTNSLSIDQGSFTLSDQVKIERFDAYFNHILIDSSRYSWHELSDSIYFNGKNLKFTYPKLSIEIAELSGRNLMRNLKIGQFKLHYDSLIQEFQSNYMQIDGINIDSLVHGKLAKLDTLIIDGANIHLAKLRLKQDSSNLLNSSNLIPFSFFQLKNSKFKWEADSPYYFYTDSLDLVLTNHDSLKLWQYKSEDLRFIDTRNGLITSIDSVWYAPQSNEIHAKNSSIKYFPSSTEMSANIFFPAIQLVDIDLKSLIKERQLRGQKLFMEADLIELESSGSAFDSTTFNGNDSLPFAIFKEIQFAVSNFSWQHGDSSSLLINKMDFQLMDFSLSEKSLLNENHFLYSDSIRVSLNEFQLKQKNNFSIDLEELVAENKDQYRINNGAFKLEDQFSIKWQSSFLKDFSLHQLINHKRISADSISISGNRVSLKLDSGNSSNDTLQLKELKGLIINHLAINDQNIYINNSPDNKQIEILDTYLTINGLQLDSIAYFSKWKNYLTSAKIGGGSLSEAIGDFYTLSTQTYLYEWPSSTLHLGNVQFKNRLNSFQYTDMLEFQSDWFDVTADNISLFGIDTDALLEEKYEIGKIAVEGSNMVVYRDLNLPVDTAKYVPMMQELLFGAKQHIIVDTIDIATNIEIKILPSEGNSIGYFSLDDLKGQILGLTTVRSMMKEPMKWNASGKLNKKADFEANVQFPVDTTFTHFFFTGKIEAMDLQSLNDMLVPMAAIEVRSGTSQGTEFTFRGNNNFSEGLIRIRYKNLRVNVLNPETYQKSGSTSAIRTFFANVFVLKKNNPTFIRVRRGLIFYERDKNRSMFNFWGKSLLSGAISNIGVNRREVKAKEYFRKTRYSIRKGEIEMLDPF